MPFSAANEPRRRPTQPNLSAALASLFALPLPRLSNRNRQARSRTAPTFQRRNGFLWIYVREVMRKSVRFAALSVGALFVSALLVRPIGDDIHGAPSYLPGLLVVLVLGVYHAVTRKPDRFTVLAAAGAYFTALFFRTIDNELCHYMTIGTRWIWHILIGLVTYLVMRSLIITFAFRNDPARTKASAPARVP